MTEQETHTDTDMTEVAEAGPVRARIRRTPWRGWLAAVPLAALILVGYLFIRAWLLTGPTITVTFPRSAGINPQSTVVKYKGLQVGNVSGVEFIDNLTRVRVTLNMQSTVADAINSGTHFWVVQPSLASGDIASLLSGAYIAMRPGQGEKRRHFKGTIGPPALPPANQDGTVITLVAQQKAGLGIGAAVLYRGMDAGQVLGASYNADADDVRIKVFVKSPFDQHVGGTTRFWRTGGIDIGRQNGDISIHAPSIISLLAGGGVTFADLQSVPAQPLLDSYKLYDSRASAQSALVGPSIAFSLGPRSSLDGLQRGAPVLLQDVKVGRVTDINTHYDANQHAIESTATIKLYALPLGITTADKAPANQVGKRLTGTVNQLIQQGMRARVASSGLILGAKQVVLDTSGSATSGGLDESVQPPRIPMTTSSGGIADVVTELSQVVNKINAIPIADIGRNLAKASANIRSLSNSSDIRQALDRLNQSLANIKAMTASARTSVGPAMKSLQNAANAAESAARAINQSIAGQGANASLSQLVDELTRTARSIRVLTSYLQRHPEALLRGRDNR